VSAVPAFVRRPAPLSVLLVSYFVAIDSPLSNTDATTLSLVLPTLTTSFYYSTPARSLSNAHARTFLPPRLRAANPLSLHIHPADVPVIAREQKPLEHAVERCAGAPDAQRRVALDAPQPRVARVRPRGDEQRVERKTLREASDALAEPADARAAECREVQARGDAERRALERVRAAVVRGRGCGRGRGAVHEERLGRDGRVLDLGQDRRREAAGDVRAEADLRERAACQRARRARGKGDVR
jgi:hypothetical protein